MSVDFIFRIMGMVAFGVVGWWVGIGIASENPPSEYMRWVLSLTLAGAALGLLLTPYFTTHPFRWVRGRIKQIPARSLFAGTLGLVVALVISALLALPLATLPGHFGRILPILVTLILGYLGIALLVMRERELFHILGSIIPAPTFRGEKQASNTSLIILDTSAIIDGRIADITQTGFLQGSLVIPRFVLNELRHIADSPDSLRRNRGRRGLDMLNRLQKESDVPIQISDLDFDDMREVDAKLVKLAKTLHCPVLTNDFNLSRVAELQGVRVLNINMLANAVKSVVLPGEEMAVRIIQEGKEAGQGVGFLDDGTMVVVEGGKRYINSELDIVVTRVLQTVAGRMIFAHPKDGVVNGRR